MNLTLRHLMSATAAVLLLVAAAGTHAQTYINTTVGGQLAPGVYGRIDIGNAPPPPLIYAEPMIIHRPAVMVPRSPIYLHVPPGHAKNWGKHCALQRVWPAGVLCERTCSRAFLRWPPRLQRSG